MTQRLNTNSNALVTDSIFNFDTDEIREELSIIDVCPKMLMKYWKEHNWYQRSPNVTSYKHDLPWDADPKRLLSLVEAANAGKTIPPIRITKGSDGSLCFPDGRHRSVIAMINNHPVIKAEVNTSDKYYILNLLAA